MLFESKYSLGDNGFNLIQNTHISFPIHIHRAFEYFEQIEGATEVTVGDRVYTLHAHDAILVFPLEPHSYTAREKGKIRICIFSPDLVSDFHMQSENKKPEDHRMPCILPQCLPTDTVFHKKALAYWICGEFEKGRAYRPDEEKSEDRLLVSLLHFADKNFNNRCLLRDAAAEIAYDYAYVSKFFKRKTGISFRQYVNNLRIIHAKQLLRSTAKGIEEISEQSGFCSLRAFDREFRAQTQMTPSEYRTKRKK